MKRKALALAIAITAFLGAAPTKGADLIGRASVIDGSEQIVGIAVNPW